MLPAARAKFVQFHAARIVAPIFFGDVVALFAQRTFQRNENPNPFLLSHKGLVQNLGDHAGANRQAVPKVIFFKEKRN